MTRYNPGSLKRSGALFREDFDPLRAVATPRGLAPPQPGNDPAHVARRVRQSLGGSRRMASKR